MPLQKASFAARPTARQTVCNTQSKLALTNAIFRRPQLLSKAPALVQSFVVGFSAGDETRLTQVITTRTRCCKDLTTRCRPGFLSAFSLGTFA
jgi:hypothetical protein